MVDDDATVARAQGGPPWPGILIELAHLDVSSGDMKTVKNIEACVATWIGREQGTHFELCP